MQDSPLSFESSKTFREKLLARNLPAYTIPGLFGYTNEPPTSEISLSDSSVIDSPSEIEANLNVDRLYPLNKFGPDGGFSKEIYYNNPPLPVESNSGPYDIMDAKFSIIDRLLMDEIFVKNKFGPQGGYNRQYEVIDVQNNDRIYLPYWDPPLFRPGNYTAYSILTQDIPSGPQGSILEDSFLMQLSARTLRGLLAYRAALYDNNLAILNGNPGLFGFPTAGSNILRGNQLFAQNDYRITPPPSTDTFLTRLQGVYIPTSPIPGDYFMDEQNTRSTGSIGQLINVFAGRSTLLGDIFGPAVSRVINPSIVFLENTGSGTKSSLFQNLSYNRYKPQYGSSTLGGLANNLLTTGVNAILDQFGTQLPGDFYVGSVISNPSNVNSPVRDVPIDIFGKETGAIVYGPQEMSSLYEGNDDLLNFGLKGKSFTDGGGLSGSLVWVSPKYKDDAGFKVGVGGQKFGQDDNFNQIEYDVTKSESTNIDFKPGSILDDTQRLIRAADRLTGERRLKHVGNAINQVSKVFHDGYKEITKGSKVLRYTNQNGVEVGQEYCRIFSKDTPYYTFSDLQKTDRNIRKFTYSVLDSPYNLNIAPMKGTESTNIVNSTIGDSRVKKYMFSIENLAWKNSVMSDKRVTDLPVCERGQNGGRVMWFPPYNIKFSENVRANWLPTTFLGRPEPIYTYKDTTRGGTLSWSIIVDHPSILNLVVNKVLSQETNRQKIDSIIDSFFAGCKKYDIYELAKIYNTVPISQLEMYQEILSDPKITEEQASNVISQIPVQSTQKENTAAAITPDPSLGELNTFVNSAFYFDNDKPTNSSDTYQNLYNTYINQKTVYTNANPSKSNEILGFFDEIERTNADLQFLVQEIDRLFKEKIIKNITLEFKSAASAPGSAQYNQTLSEKRCEIIKKFFETYGTPNNLTGGSLKQYIDNGSLIINCKSEGELTTVTTSSSSINCTGIATTAPDNVYSAPAMACRSVRLTSINPTPADPEPASNEENEQQTVQENNGNNGQNPYQQQPIKPQAVNQSSQIRPGLTKKILRELLSECDYFEVIKDSDPMIYETIKEKIKYFNPAFHSMTPEGLNARLTFLQQCLRPGNTIPIKDSNGSIKEGGAYNTNFATPPVLILRIGDFYNTKIIPNSIDITYEPLIFDTNPEGIGVQPMLANITMSFNFIGGSGLAKPIEQLQNSLSFNYYANTEMYDERAEATEDTSALDKEVLDAIKARERLLSTKDVKNALENGGGTTIGTILKSTGTTTDEKGEISYKVIMDNLSTDTQEYFDLIVGKCKTIMDSYNKGILELVTSDRKYTDGTINVAAIDAPIFGKPMMVEEKIKGVFDELIKTIENETNPLITGVSKFTQSGDVKENLIKYFNDAKLSWSLELMNLIQDMVNSQQKYVQIFRKLNFVLDSKDGKILKNGDSIVYNLTPTTEITPSSGPPPVDTFMEIENDYSIVGVDIEQFSILLENKNIVTNTYTSSLPGDFNDLTVMFTDEKILYMVMSRTFLDKNKLKEFNDSIIKGPLKDVKNPQRLTKVFEEVTDKLRDVFKKEHKKGVELINDFIKSQDYKKYKKYKPYSLGKVRKFLYDAQPIPATTFNDEIIAIYSSSNQDNDTSTYMNKIVFN